MALNQTIPVFPVTSGEVSKLTPLFQKGFLLEEQVGCSVESLFYERWHLSRDFVEQRIGTVFVDYRPVDDLDRTLVKDGSVMALSSAMPGLVGAVMRRRSPFAGMRQSISAGAETVSVAVRQGIITVKLFNLLIRELGPLFLKKGMVVDGNDLQSVIDRYHGHLDSFPSRVRLVLNET